MSEQKKCWRAGGMFCLTGIGARVADIVKTVEVADATLAIQRRSDFGYKPPEGQIVVWGAVKGRRARATVFSSATV